MASVMSRGSIRGSRRASGAGGLESPVGRRPLRLAQLQELAPPPIVRPEREPLHDEPVHRLQHEHFGQQELTLGRGLQLGGRLVPEAQQLVPADGVLVALDPLEDVLLVVLLVRVRRAAPLRSAAQLRDGQHAASTRWARDVGAEGSGWRGGYTESIDCKVVSGGACVNAKKDQSGLRAVSGRSTPPAAPRPSDSWFRGW